MTDYNIDEHVNHELYLYDLNRVVNYLDMTALVYVTGSAVNIFEEHDTSIKPIVQLRANPDSNHSINLFNKNELYFPLISRQDYFDGVLFQESIDIKDTITLRSINNFNQKLSSIVDIYSSLNSGQTSVKYRRRTTKLPHYAIHNSKICTDLVDDMIKDSAACLSKNVEKVSFDLIDFESTVSEKGAADSVNTLHQDFKIGRELKHLVVVGDGKTYDLLVKLKLELKDDLSWLLPFPGDWHILKNYQRMITKLYLDAELKELIELFHHGAVGASVMQATNFDETHHFLMQVWEAFYLQQISAILKYAEENDLNDQSEENYIIKVSFVLQNQELSQDEKIQQHLDLMSHFSLQFRNLCCRLSEQNENWKFWHDFIHYHGFIYVSYFLSIRSGNWHLRNYCLKHVAKTAQITDCKFYSRLLPFHIADLKSFPKSTIEHFEEGGWVVNILGRNMHSQGLGEAHESCFNREVKNAMSNFFTLSALTKLVHYIPFRAKVLGNIKDQLECKRKDFNNSVNRPSFEIQNISSYRENIESGLFFRYENGQLKHAFNSKVVLTDIQRSDLLNLQKIAQEHLGKYIKICQSDGIFRYNKTRKIATFSTKTHSISKVKRELKDQRTENSLLRKQIAWSKERNTPISDLQQFISLPRAIVDHDGLPFKGDKSKTLDIYHSRYPEAFENKLHVKPDCVIIDGMFILNSKPLKSSNRINRFIRCLESDPDLHSIEKDDLPLIIQNLFILTGCDYVSFFKDHGKTSFFKTFFKYTEFITSSVENNVIGKLSLTNSDDISSFLSFIRLIGCEYWRKCSSAFLRENLETPEQLYRTVYSSNLSPKENHIAWISKIREALYSRVPSEEFYLPSFDALFLHWKRSYWVSRVWVQAYCENDQYPSLTDFGWKLKIDGQLDVIWNSPENLQKVCNTEETEENTAESVASTQVLYNSESDASDFGDDTMDGSVFFELQNVDDDDLENIIFNFQYQHLA
ncbi:unnamed protein product [Mytilus coruscus]|uniref:DUF6589 domain-containing protein n=1 Tax=Mytilus coruscus TaxID=42192 RepID=A0A6J8C3A3_MYTCO|nr:unnamed protein product [Mytilus coruscus]